MRLIAVVGLLVSVSVNAQQTVYGPLSIGSRAQLTQLDALTHSLDAGAVSPSETTGTRIEGFCAAGEAVRAIWFKTGAASGGREIMIRNSVQSATMVVTPHAWNRHLLASPISCGFVQLYFTTLAGSDAELELLPLPGFTHDVRQSGPPTSLYLKTAQGSPSPNMPAVVLELQAQGDDHAEAACAATVPRVAGNGYTHFEPRTLGTGESVTHRVLVPSEREPGAAVWVERLEVPLEIDGGSEVRWTLALGDGGTATGLIAPTSPTTLGAELPVNVRFAPHASLDAGESLLTLEVTRGEATVFYAATDVDPLGRCGAVSRTTWRGTIAGEWSPDAGHRDLLFRLVASPNPRPRYRDVDGDGFGDPNTTVTSSGSVAGYVPISGDCDDTNANVFLGAPETCNAIDDDCDGLVDGADPIFQLTSCPEDAGICRRDHRASECVDGGWVACAPEPVERSCNGLDDDCDGLVDEGLPGAMCALQLGVCAGSHLPMCMPGSTAVCTAVDYGPGFEASETTCDGLDNDCDGHADALDPELAVIPCERSLGVCEGAARTADSCTSGGWRACDRREYGPSFVNGDAICDGLDNDCDGAVDEDCLAEAPKGCGCAGAGMTGTWLLLAAALLGKRRR